MHVVLVDNGRSERLGMAEFWTSLKCIRCGACMTLPGLSAQWRSQLRRHRNFIMPIENEPNFTLLLDPTSALLLKI